MGLGLPLDITCGPGTIQIIGKGMLEMSLTNKKWMGLLLSHPMSSKSPWDGRGSILLHHKDVGHRNPLVSGAGDSSGVTKAIAPPGINSRLDPKRLAGDSDSLFPASNICVLPLNLCCCTGSGWTSLPEAFFCGEGRSSGGCESAEPGSAPGILSCTQHLNVPMILPQDQGVETGSTKAQPGGTPHGTAKAELRHRRPGNHLSSLCKDLLPPPPHPLFPTYLGTFLGPFLTFCCCKTQVTVCDRHRHGGL